MSQTALGDALDLTFQQVQKYEKGSNRVGASRLYALSKILDVPISYFYEDMPEELQNAPQTGKRPAGEEPQLDTMNKRETLELVRAYYQIKDENIRTCLREFLKAMAAESQKS